MNQRSLRSVRERSHECIQQHQDLLILEGADKLIACRRRPAQLHKEPSLEQRSRQELHARPGTLLQRRASRMPQTVQRQCMRAPPRQMLISSRRLLYTEDKICWATDECCLLCCLAPLGRRSWYVLHTFQMHVLATLRSCWQSLSIL